MSAQASQADREIGQVPFSVTDIRVSSLNGVLYDAFSLSNPDDNKLVEDIRERGILVPLYISEDGVLLSGHRRLAAAQHLGLATVPVIVDDKVFGALSETEQLKLLKSHNAQREKSRDEQLREAMLEIDADEAYGDLVQYRAAHQRVAVESNVVMGIVKGRARITTMDFLRATRAVVEGQREDWPLTVRRVHYLLLNDPPLRHDRKRKSTYRNDKQSYKALTNLLIRARLAGTIPIDAIEDSTRPVTVWNTYRHPAAFVQEQSRALFRGYWRDLMQGQEHHVEVLVEKDGLRKIVEQVAGQYTIPCTTGRGYASLSPRFAMATRFRNSGKAKLVLLILSDFDPDGEQIAASFARSLRDDFDINDVHAVKVALTADDVRDYSLPSDLEAKAGSSTYKAFVAKYGTHVCELDAAPKELLQRKLREAIEGTINVQAFNHEVEEEKGDCVWIEAHRKLVKRTIGQQTRHVEKPKS